MSNLKLIKPDRELALKLDYILCKKNNVDWIQAYKRMCMLQGRKFILQENRTEEEYYNLVNEPKFQYYLLDNDIVVGRAILSRKGNNLMDIQYVLIEEEYRNKGYGIVIFKLLESEIMKDEDIEGIIIEDASESKQTSKIVNKLGYKKIDDFQFIKYRDDFINNKIK